MWCDSLGSTSERCVSPVKLQGDVPNLLADTWFLEVGCMNGTSLFGTHRTKTVRCEDGMASINPEYKLRRALEVDPGDGIPVRQFAEWFADLHEKNEDAIGRRGRKDPWLVRGLRIAIVQPSGESGG